MSVEGKGVQPPRAAAKTWIGKQLRVEVKEPTIAEEDAAYLHLFHQAEAAFGASLLAKEMRNAKGNGDRGLNSRYDQLIEIITALRRASKLSQEKFLFMAVSQASHVHEKRMMDGDYADDLGAIEASIRAIEKEEGLKDDEFWPNGSGPDEWNALQQRWNDVTDTHLNEVLRELGWEELADFRESDRQAFDALFEQGRRSVHNKNDHRNAVAHLIGQYESEAKRAEAGQAPYAAMTMYGAACEARLLLRVLDCPEETDAAVTRLANRKISSDPMKWTLETLINVASEAGWLTGIHQSDANAPLLEWAHTLRAIRNLLHPGRHSLEHPHESVGDTQVQNARSIYIVISRALTDSAST